MGKAYTWLAAFWIHLWYGLTQFFTQFGGHPIPRYKGPHEIVAALDYGDRYRKDRRAGAMTHPRKVQRRMDDNQRLGDCEDHMGYWVVSLAHSNLAEELYSGTIEWLTPDGKIDGHTVAVFKHKGDYYWADYTDPHPIANIDDWIKGVLSEYGGTFRWAVLHHVHAGHLDQVVFGKAKLYPNK